MDQLSKIIQCDLEEIVKIAGQKGLKIVWSGTGIVNSDNLGVVRTDIFKYNPETQEWSILEINGPTKVAQ